MSDTPRDPAWAAELVDSLDDTLRALLKDTQIRAHAIQLSACLSAVDSLRRALGIDK